MFIVNNVDKIGAFEESTMAHRREYFTGKAPFLCGSVFFFIVFKILDLVSRKDFTVRFIKFMRGNYKLLKVKRLDGNYSNI